MAYTTIDDPSAHFQNKIYVGNATDDTAYTNDGNSNLQPDFLWVKNRQQTVDHVLFDSTRGVTKNVRSNTSSQESTNSNYLKSFDSNGFTMGTSNRVNGNTDEMVAWQWKANGGTTSSNSSGSITSTVQANTTAGFSIVTYTGAGGNQTIAHGLGAVPKWILIKRRDGAGDWTGYYSVLGDEKFMRLNSTNAVGDQATYFNDTTPTSTVFTVGNAGDVNQSSGTHVAYCFAEIQGYSKFGSYEGNGNADGPFVHTGFKPAWVLIKRTEGSDHWYLYDIARAETKGNEVDIAIEASNANVEFDTSGDLDFLSNGFKNRGSITVTNASGEKYIYMAFAEHPFVSSEGIPVTAR